MADRLTPIQREVIHAFFAREHRFHLTGGAALGGFLTRHRDTEDIDLFTPAPVLNEADGVLRDVAAAIGATYEEKLTASHIHRRLLRRGDEMVKVELVHDPVVQGPEPKLDFDGVRVDPPSEILANKLCALLGRNELRDLVDACVLERSGQDLETALELASRKDGGCTPLVLADLLLAWDVGPSARVPSPLDRDSLLAYRDDLVDRLLRIARAQVPERRG